MRKNTPRVSIGMPVFNGEKYLKEAIDSILVQTFPDFELIISDNASDDHTQQICMHYASRDHRVHYFRNDKNIGGPKNYNRVFKLSSGEYFKWAAYDDVLAPEYLRKCICVLDKYPSLVGCHSKTGLIDQEGKVFGFYNPEILKKIDSIKPHERFRELMGLYYATTPFHGIYRSSKFSRSQLHGSYIGADRNLVAELSLLGRIHEIPECLFFWRLHPDSYTTIFYGRDRKKTLDSLKAEATWWSNDNGTYFPHWKNCVEYFKSVNRVQLELIERILCYIQILGWFLEEGNRFMAKDIIFFLMQNSSLSRKLLQKVPKQLKHKFLEIAKI